MGSINSFKVEAPRYSAIKLAYPSLVPDALLDEAEAPLGHRAYLVAGVDVGTGKMT